MPKSKGLIFLPVLLCLLLNVAQSEKLFAEDKKLKPEEVVANHLQSLGKPELVQKIQSRAFKGTASFEFVQGMTGSSPDGQLIFASEGNKLGLVLTFNDLVYPGEYFAFNGEEVTVGHISPGQRSPLADFIYRYNGLMKEGLLGGVWSTSWPLLDIRKKQPTLRYKEAQIDGRKLHELEYRPQKGFGDLKIKIYFDFETYRHVRTEYRVRVKDDNSTRREGASRRQSVGISRYPGDASGSEIFDAAPDSIYVLVEKFDDFHDYSGLMLPAVCSYEYSVEGQGSSIIAHWTMKAGAVIVHNGKVREDFFVAQK